MMDIFQKDCHYELRVLVFLPKNEDVEEHHIYVDAHTCKSKRDPVCSILDQKHLGFSGIQVVHINYLFNWTETSCSFQLQIPSSLVILKQWSPLTDGTCLISPRGNRKENNSKDEAMLLFDMKWCSQNIREICELESHDVIWDLLTSPRKQNQGILVNNLK